MIEYKKEKKQAQTKRTFTIYEAEIVALKELKERGINVSDFLRYAIRTFNQELKDQEKQ